MTITEPTNAEPTSTGLDVEGLCWLNVADLQAHPENPRTSVGDLTELTRSIRAMGVLQPLLVLPANDDGVYYIAAGKRRHSASIKADVSSVPCVIRDLTVAEIIEVGLSENANRTDLSLSEEVQAIARLMSLDSGVSPAKLCKRIGRSQAWVRDRMAVTVLPERWRKALDASELSLSAGAAAASVADLGPEHLDAVCEALSGSRWQEPGYVVQEYRDRLRRAANYDTAVDKSRTKLAVVFTDDDPAPPTAKRLGELFDIDGCKLHQAEPCHAVVLRRTTWGDGHDQYEVCVDPRRHTPAKVGTANGSDLASERATTRPSAGGSNDSHAKRKARLERIGYTADVFARSRGGISQTELTRLALTALIHEAGQDTLKYAATILDLGLDPKDVRPSRLFDGVVTHAALVRVAGAVALGQAEAGMYWSSGSPQCRAYLAALLHTGWSPDEWSQAVLDRNADTDEPDDEDDDDSEPGDDDEEDDEQPADDSDEAGDDGSADGDDTSDRVA